MSKVIVIKKDGTQESFKPNKIRLAVKKASDRVVSDIPDCKIEFVIEYVLKHINPQTNTIEVNEIHNLVEKALTVVDESVANSYKEYRNYKRDFVSMMDEVYNESEKIRYIGDRDNANTDATMVSTQRSLIYQKLNKELYKKFFLNNAERQAINDGYIYIHDMGARLDCINCSLFDVANVLNGGFEMGNLWYNEPKSLDVAFDVISDVIINSASCQYGGITICELDKLLNKYAEMSYSKYYDECVNILKHGNNIELSKEQTAYAEDYATKKVYRDFEQGFQSWEMRFNSVGSSRGDYPFIAVTIGLGTSKFEKMATEVALRTRMNGQGKNQKKKIVLFPKISFLYDEELHGESKPNEDLFKIAIECSCKSMYPDYISLTGEGYIPSIYKKYKVPISLMGCRASLSPWYEQGGFIPSNNDDKPIYVGRFNCGAISLHLPMILAKAREENKDFYEVLDYYLEMIRNLHQRTKNYLGNKKASTNPLGFCQGGFLGGTLNPDDKIAPLLEPMTYSFGITALNELNRLYNGKSIYEDGEFPLQVMKYINKKIEEYKEQDHMLYAIYGTPKVWAF